MTHLILASRSAARRKMLADLGLSFKADSTDIDEAVVKNAGQKSGLDPVAIALDLAVAKAMALSTRYPDAYILGADQILVFAGKIHDKSSSIMQLAKLLLDMAGKEHQLISAYAICRGGKVVRTGHDSAFLTMKPLKQADIDDYLSRAGDRVLASVGGYELEGLGAQLFEHIKGDFFTILGLPVFPLMRDLKDLGVDCGLLGAADKGTEA